MSSILASLDMSLDDIISNKKKSNPDARPAKSSGGGGGGGGGRGRGASGGAGPVRNRRNRSGRKEPYSRGGANDDDELMDVDEDDAPAAKQGGKRRAVTVKAQQGKGAKKGSILSRLGKPSNTDANAGTKIVVKNLKFDILEDDVRELFSTVGKVTKAEIVYDRSGRSKGIARVWYAKHADAEKAIKQYDGRTLDGQAMSITLDTDKNVRNGLFGTALSKSDDVTFKVNLGDKKDSRGRGRGGGRGGRNRGGGRAKEGGGSKTAEDLDNEMDSYMKDA